jgi:hypothetical protein
MKTFTSDMKIGGEALSIRNAAQRVSTPNKESKRTITTNIERTQEYFLL